MQQKIILFFILFFFLIPCSYSDAISYSNAVLASIPVGYWKLDENGGNIAADSSGYNHAGTYHNVSWVSGPFSNTKAMDIHAASSSYVNISESGTTSLDISPYITMEAWIKPTSYSVSGDRGMILNKENAWEYGLQDGTGALQSALYTNTWAWRGSSVIPLNVWSHVVLTYDGSMVRHYVNGILVDSYSYTGILVKNDEDIRIGARGGDGGVSSFFEGGIAQVAVYNKALSADTIKQHYDAAFQSSIPEPNSIALLICGICVTVRFFKRKK